MNRELYLGLTQMMPKAFPDAIGIHLEGPNVKLDSLVADIHAVLQAKGYSNYGLSRLRLGQRELVYLNPVDAEAAQEQHHASCRNSLAGVLTGTLPEVVTAQTTSEEQARIIAQDRRRLGDELLTTLIAKGGWGLPQGNKFETEYLYLARSVGDLEPLTVSLVGPVTHSNPHMGSRFDVRLDGGKELGRVTMVFLFNQDHWFLDSRTADLQWPLTPLEEVDALHTAIIRARFEIGNGSV